MQAPSIYLIVAAEIAALLLFVCVFLVMQNRTLRLVVQKLQSRVEKLVRDLRLATSKKSKDDADQPKTTYQKHLSQQLELIKEYHANLGADQDIKLDIAPETPLERRAAAMRYALLLAEKEATTNRPVKQVNWKSLQRRYEQIFEYYLQYGSQSSSPAENNSEEIDAIREELTNAKKRINNLERFKALYFDLEEKWEAVRNNAKTHYNEISQLAADSDNSEAIETALQAYHNNYGELGTLIEAGIDNNTNNDSVNAETSSEVRHLRAVAADQHRIITELQKKLKNASSNEEREEAVVELQGQLQKQIRFVQESETCIQLLEDELNNANKELDQLRSRINQLPMLKSDLKELRNQNDEYEMQIAMVKSENRRLAKSLKNIESAPPPDNGEARALKKELAELETRYAELEEKFLDLKLQG